MEGTLFLILWIVTNTRKGTPKLLDKKNTTINKRVEYKNYHLKMKSSRFSLSEINQKFPIMPFTTRFICSYITLDFNIKGDYVAHIKFTIVLMLNGSDQITSHSLQEPTKMIYDLEIKVWLALGTKTKKRVGGFGRELEVIL
uniref:Uncharacterized protein n=1 Tax=Populus trichocarpa TaxID=3694 RepID=A0A2K1WWS9_POPTR